MGFSPAGTGERPALLLVAVDMGRHYPSESGKSWTWACALARHYALHVITAPAIAERCRAEPQAAEWQWHPTHAGQPRTSGLSYYREYARWCGDATRTIRACVPRVRPVGLHHITLGSFRVLPAYHRCGVPYTLGPLGGGESTPWAYLRTARLPLRSWCAELTRPGLNRAAALVPGLRAIVRGSRLAMGTTPETEVVLRRMGARTTAVGFPDCLHADVDSGQAEPAEARAATLPQRVELVWSGRGVWWKAGHLAIELLRRLAAAGTDAELTLYSYGPAVAAWQRQIARDGLSARCRINGFVPRRELLHALGGAHGFVFPSLHDSANSSVLEAYAMGLPSLTVGLGGPAVIATAETGFNRRTENLDAWMDGAVETVRNWQREPAQWLRASAAAQARSREFGPAQVEALVDRWLSPAVYR